MEGGSARGEKGAYSGDVTGVKLTVATAWMWRVRDGEDSRMTPSL